MDLSYLQPFPDLLNKQQLHLKQRAEMEKEALISKKAGVIQSIVSSVLGLASFAAGVYLFCRGLSAHTTLQTVAFYSGISLATLGVGFFGFVIFSAIHKKPQSNMTGGPMEPISLEEIMQVIRQSPTAKVKESASKMDAATYKRFAQETQKSRKEDEWEKEIVPLLATHPHFTEEIIEETFAADFASAWENDPTDQNLARYASLTKKKSLFKNRALLSCKQWSGEIRSKFFGYFSNEEKISFLDHAENAQSDEVLPIFQQHLKEEEKALWSQNHDEFVAKNFALLSDRERELFLKGVPESVLPLAEAKVECFLVHFCLLNGKNVETIKKLYSLLDSPDLKQKFCLEMSVNSPQIAFDLFQSWSEVEKTYVFKNNQRFIDLFFEEFDRSTRKLVVVALHENKSLESFLASCLVNSKKFPQEMLDICSEFNTEVDSRPFFTALKDKGDLLNQLEKKEYDALVSFAKKNHDELLEKLRKNSEPRVWGMDLTFLRYLAAKLNSDPQNQ